MKRRSIFQAIAGLFAAPAVVAAKPRITAPNAKSLMAVMAQIDKHQPVRELAWLEAVTANAKSRKENPLFSGKPVTLRGKV